MLGIAGDLFQQKSCVDGMRVSLRSPVSTEIENRADAAAYVK